MTVTEYLQNLVDNRTLAIIALVLAVVAGYVLRCIYEGIRDMIRTYRWEKQEAEAEMDSTRILDGLHPERLPAVDNDEYFRVTTDGKGYRLNDKWRELVEQTKPRSPEIVAEQTYSFYRQRYPEPIQAQAWPRWSIEERTVAGRHRADGSALRAVNTPTQEWKLVSV